MEEEYSRLLVKHVTMNGRDFDATGVQSLNTGLTSFPNRTKSPVIAALPLPVLAEN
jgi:hypothetical protein